MFSFSSLKQVAYRQAVLPHAWRLIAAVPFAAHAEPASNALRSDFAECSNTNRRQVRARDAEVGALRRGDKDGLVSSEYNLRYY
jgi:hypothetical protein